MGPDNNGKEKEDFFPWSCYKLYGKDYHQF